MHLPPVEIPHGGPALLGHLNTDSLAALPQDNQYPPPAIQYGGWPMIKTETSFDTTGNVAGFTEYFYDANWYLIEESYTGTYPNNSYTRLYSYPPGKVKVTGRSDIYLDGNGQASWEYQYNYEKLYYYFNGNGNLTGQTYPHGSSSYYYGPDGNMYAEGGTGEMYPYTIFTNNTFTYNTGLSTIGNYNRGKYYMGKTSVNNVEYVHYHSDLNGGPGQHNSFATFSYTYNSSGWIIRVDGVHADLGAYGSTDTTYSYSRTEYTYY
jgi:hypothetical protein